MTPSFLESHPGPVLVGAIASDDQFSAARDAAAEVDLFEFRLDLSLDGDTLMQHAPDVGKPVMLTLRAREEGGQNTQSPDERLQQLSRYIDVAPQHVALVDMEIRTAQRAKGDNFKVFKEKLAGLGIGLALSSHHLDTTPDKPNLLAEMTLAKNLGGDVFKVATTTRTHAEFNHLMTFAEAALKQGQVAFMGMGEFGKISRLLAAKTGSRLVYCAIEEGKGTALGQWTAASLKAALATV
jgi:3-dehydroquinate dehydratase-1